MAGPLLKRLLTEAAKDLDSKSGTAALSSALDTTTKLLNEGLLDAEVGLYLVALLDKFTEAQKKVVALEAHFATQADQIAALRAELDNRTHGHSGIS